MIVTIDFEKKQIHLPDDNFDSIAKALEFFSEEKWKDFIIHLHGDRPDTRI